MLNENAFLHYIKVITDILIAPFDDLPRVSSIQNLVFGLPKRKPGTVKALFQNSVACRSLCKSSHKVYGGEVLSRLLLKFLEDMKRNFGKRSPRGFGRNTDFGKICVELLKLVFEARLSHLVVFSCSSWGFYILTLR